MTIYQLAKGAVPTVDVQKNGLVGLYVRDDDPDAAGEFHGFLMNPAVAVELAADLLATAGDIGGADAALTIFGNSFAFGDAVYAGQPVFGLIVTDRDNRTVRLAFTKQAAEQIGRQFEALSKPAGGPRRH